MSSRSSRFRWFVSLKAPEQLLRSFSMYPPQVMQVLFNRGLTTKEAVEAFFREPDLSFLPDPFLLTDMDFAVKRVIRAIEEHERVVVHGDCDPDGACGAAVLFEFFRALGADVSVYLPDSEREGHHVSGAGVEEIIRRGATLVVTVDGGVREHGAVAALRAKGIDTIILDHHLPAETLPDAAAVVDPYRSGDRYPFKPLCGTGVAFMYAQAVANSELGKKLPQRWLESCLDIVGIATISDLVPLQDANRILVRLGLSALRKTQRSGLLALYEAASIEAKAITARTVAFEISTRLNAASRYDHTDTAFALLTTTQQGEAQRLAKEMNKQNRLRQKTIASVTQDAVREVDENALPFVLVLASASWSSQALGVSAGRLVERFRRPVFLFHIANGLARASARSFGGFDLVAAMRACGGKELFVDFGGHAMAAGCTIRTDWLPLLRERLEEYAKTVLTSEMLVPTLRVDLEVGAQEIGPELVSWFDRLEPFGKGNSRPRILLSNLVVLDARKVGRGEKTLALKVAGGPIGRTFMAFARGEAAAFSVRAGDTIDAVGELQRDEWRGGRGVVFSILDMRMHADKNTSHK